MWYSERMKPSESLSALERHRRLSSTQVAELIGVKSRQSVWNWTREGKLPQPVYIKPNVARWILGDVLDKIYEEQQTMDEAPRGLNGAEEEGQLEQASTQEATTEENEESKGAAQKVLERLFGLSKSH